MSFDIRPATSDEVVYFLENPPRLSMRAFVVCTAGVPTALFGLYFSAGRAWSFCRIKGQHSPVSIYRTAKRCMAELRKLDLPFGAIAQDGLESAPRFLSHLGFEYLGTCADGEVYQWPQR